MKIMNRREWGLNLMPVVVGGIAALTMPTYAVAATPSRATQQQLIQLIDQVQAAVKAGCSFVPTARSVLAVLMALSGFNTQIAALTAVVQQAITLISLVCPRSAAPQGAQAAPITVLANGKSVPVAFH